MFNKSHLFLLTAAVATSALVLPAHADVLNASNWVEHTFTAGGVEGTNAFGAPTQSANAVVGAVPTNSANWSYASGGGQGYQAVEHLAATSGPLLGDLSGDTGLAANFTLNNTAITAGATFTTADFGGELNGSGNPAEKILLYLRSSVTDPGGAAYGGLSEWWYNGNVADVTTLQNGVATSLDADFSDLSHWTDIGGLSAAANPAETAAFQATLSQVTALGLSFGSGNYFSDGFGFSGDGTGAGTVTLNSFAAVPTPEPASLSLLALGALGLLARRRKA